MCIDFLIKPIYRVCYYSEMCYIVVLYGIIDCCCLYLSCSTRRMVFMCKILVKDTPRLCVVEVIRTWSCMYPHGLYNFAEEINDVPMINISSSYIQWNYVYWFGKSIILYLCKCSFLAKFSPSLDGLKISEVTSC